MKTLHLIERDQKIASDLLRPFADRQRRYALLDFPDHSNVGDSAIWLGEVKLLTDIFNAKPAYCCSTESFDSTEMEAALGNGVIFLHGGGNFGDIYERHQAFREMIVARYPMNRIIQLPQSISYKDVAGVKKTASILKNHQDFHLFVRDVRSQGMVRNEFGCPAYLCPDLAFAIGPIRKSVHTADTVFLLRQDRERVRRDDTVFKSVPNSLITDWVGEPKRNAGRDKNLGMLKALASGHWEKNSIRYVVYNRIAQRRFQRGLDLLSGASVVVTDRLHAHIISVLLDIPHVVLDNDYGKIRAYMDEWTKDLAIVHSADSSIEAISKLNEIRGA